jgi:nicotinic acid phosphoribosyltransferase
MLNQLQFNQSLKTKFLSIQEAANLRKQADGMPYGVRRNELLQKAIQMDAAIQIDEWVSSSGLRKPT